MDETPLIRAATVYEGLTLLVTFANGEARLFNVAPYADGSSWYAELREPAYFAQVRLVWGGSGIEWPNEQDFSRDTVYLAGTPINPAESALKEAAL